ncbi:amidase [Zavarzinia sp. CC-PAN008]|uniref:amidase n=1 Tax=Zavarzinia sp. CC-PAN008 TaxID=3243332 RepID=UPI003F742559
MAQDLHYWSLAKVAAAIRHGSLTSTAVTEAILDRIAALEPRLHAYATVTPAIARAAAEQADRELARGQVRGPLHGVPIAVKDLCFTTDAPTAAGTAIHRGWMAPHDATVVQRFRLAGAPILGKLELTEGAMLEHHPSVTPPVSPWDADYWTGASSSGSGVATAAGLCYGSLGSDTGGSIRFPSTACNLTGLKPTWGRVSRHGVFALSESFDHVGPMCRSAEDAALVLQVIAGADEADFTCLRAPVPDYAAALAHHPALALKGLRIGVDRRHIEDGSDDEVVGALDEMLAVLLAHGARIVPIDFPAVEDVLEAGRIIIAVDAAASHAETYPSRAADYGPPLAPLLAAGNQIGGMDLIRAQRVRADFAGRVAALFDAVDVVIQPAIPMRLPTVRGLGELMEEDAGLLRLARFTMPFDASGSPTITLPAGVDRNGLPIGVQLIGPHLAEDLLLRAGHAFQQATDWHTRRPDL